MFYSNRELAFYIKDVFKATRSVRVSTSENRKHTAMSFRLSGKAVFEYNGKTVTAEPGSIIYIPPGIDYKITEEEQTLIILHLATYNDDHEIEMVKPKNFNAYLELFEEMLKEAEQKRVGYKHRLSSMLSLILAKLEIESNEKYSMPEYHRIERGVDYMRANYSNPQLTITEIANCCGISEVYFRKIYKSVFGVSPLKDLNDLRIRRSCAMLKSHYYKIYTIAESCGFPNVKYFSSTFKKHMGMSPGEYAKKHP